MNTIPDSVSFSQLCSFLKAKVSQDDFAQEVALDWEDRLSEILFEFESSLDDSTQNKTADQLMALGSFRTYLMLSLRALKSSGLLVLEALCCLKDCWEQRDRRPKPHGMPGDLASCSLHIQKFPGCSTGSDESLRDRAVIQSQSVA